MCSRTEGQPTELSRGVSMSLCNPPHVSGMRPQKGDAYNSPNSFCLYGACEGGINVCAYLWHQLRWQGGTSVCPVVLPSFLLTQ